MTPARLTKLNLTNLRAHAMTKLRLTFTTSVVLQSISRGHRYGFDRRRDIVDPDDRGAGEGGHHGARQRSG